jgi:hypothetical protein
MTPVHLRARLLSTTLGVVMAAAAGIHTAGVPFILAILAALAVLAGTRIRVAATLAVLLAAAAVMLADIGPLATGFAGLSGAVYLMLRHTEREVSVLTGRSSPVLAAALGFTVISVSAAYLTLDLPWLPILAPPTIFLTYVLAIQPFISDIRD